MQQQAITHIAKQNPFLRFIFPLALGIILGWYEKIPVMLCWILLATSFFFIIYVSFGRISSQFRFRHFTGIGIYVALITMGMLLVYYHDQRNDATFIGKLNGTGSVFTATIDNQPTIKGKTLKAAGIIRHLVSNGRQGPATGHIVVYFHADGNTAQIRYGDQILFCKTPDPIVNSSKAGTFDYQRYCALQNIYFQVALQPNDYLILPIKNSNPLREAVLRAREKVVAILKKYIVTKKESGLAEAMLVGYKDDLDKDLLQSYTNTGVVHVIAISGLHLALIWWLLTSFCKLMGKSKVAKIVQPVIVIAGLWLFSILTGGSASVMRSAVMFTFLAVGNSIGRKASIYNSLAASAFLLLCYNPFWLWDIGFQLSYSAVLSLAIFMKPIYNWLKPENKILHHAWKVCAATLAAQILTLPLCIFYFNQVPMLFLLANLFVVPLSGVILAGELFLCSVYFIPPLAKLTGLLLRGAIFWMNSFIESLNRFSFATLGGLYLNTLQVICLYFSITAFAIWLMHRNNRYVIPGLTSILLIMIIRCFLAFP